MTEAGAIVEVEVDPATAFEVFTSEASAWWHRDRALFGPDAAGVMRFEPGAGGRLLLDGKHEVGRVSVWEPTPRLVFSYGPPGGAEHDRTEVEVRFEATELGTRVVLRHRGWTPPGTWGDGGREGDQQDPAGGQWSAVLASFARHSLERALLHRLGEFLDAIGAGDAEFFERNLTEDALMIFPGPGNVYTKANCIASMREHPPYVKYDIADPKIVHIGGNTAVLTHRATVLNTGWTAPRALVVSSVLTKVDGVWRLALHQWTPTDDNNN
jgi:ketosteroid isomerase-like protein